ncbi:very-long-chain ceramide synthase [Entomortierella parvispora]|uniref:Very-long-chain ceramide synthase n=1 Tax=Entomortierella parvispora TaxID=205924 RepID=A0A9P3HLA0_9FUNG|nr:very-long-chain ceramide synthase [Entomortierella parvispora]
MANLQDAGLGSSSSPSLRPPMTARDRANSFRRKASIDSETGQPHHYHHRRHHHHDPTRGRSPSPPEGAPRYIEVDHGHEVDPTQPIYKYNVDGFLIPTERPVPDQTWASFLIQHQLVLSCSVILAVVASHMLIVSKEARDGHSVDWIGSMNALIPPPLWERLPLSWTNVTLGGHAMVKKWTPKSGAYDPNKAWSSRALALQYQQIVKDPKTGETEVLYGKGWDDLYMVLVWVMIWTAVREAAMTYLLIPLGQAFGVGGKPPKKAAASSPASVSSPTLSSTGVGKKAPSEKSQREARMKLKKEQHAREGKLLRFAEQGWLVIYDGCMWTFGMCLLYHSQYWSDTSFYWHDYPKTLLSGTMKWYYLIQFAFWLQQLLLAILGIEKRRKDFLEFMIHHIVTCLLIGFSYSFNLTSVGHAVLCAMDFSDIVLAVCKMLKYMHKDKTADVGFVFFVVTWIMSRHYYYGIIIWSCFVEAPKFTNEWNPAEGYYLTTRVLTGFQILLCALYALLLFWLAMIARVVMKVLKGENSEDVRSEEEPEEEEEEEKEQEEEDATQVQEEKPLLKTTMTTTRPVKVSA